MKKRIISLLMVFTMLIGLLAMAGCDSKNETEADISLQEQLLTKEQWIIGLGSVFGMNEYISDEIYFTDVPKDSELYPFLQSCAEWGIFEQTGIEFKPEQLITRKEAVKTAVIASEALNNLQKEEVYKECIPYAVKAGILKSDEDGYLAESISQLEGQEILDWALTEYQNREFVEYANVELKEDVEDLTQCDVSISEDFSTVSIAADVTETLEVGEIFVAPGTMEYPYGIARKVVSVDYDENGNQIVVTEEPAIEELYKELDFATRVVPELDDIVVGPGVTVASVDEENFVFASASNNGLQPVIGRNNDSKLKNVAKGATYKFNVNFTKGSVKLSPEFETSLGKFTADIASNGGDSKAGEWFKKSNVLYKGKSDGTMLIDQIENKFSGGYEITGDLKISNFYIEAEAKPQKTLGIVTGIKSFDIRVNADTDVSLKVKGKIEDKLTLSTFHVATPVPGLTVRIDLVLSASANGELELKLETTNLTTVTYSSGKIKKTTDSAAELKPVVAGIKIEAGPEIKAMPSILGVKIIDVSVALSGEMKFSSTVKEKEFEEEREGQTVNVEETYWTISGEYIVPIVKLKVGYEKKAIIKIGASWELVGKNGLIKIDEKDMFEEVELLISETVTYLESETETETELETETSAEVIDSEALENTESKEGILSTEGVIDISTYMLNLKVGESTTIEIVGLPDGYEMSDVTWRSDDPSIVVVSNGNVTALEEGVTYIVVSTVDGCYEASCAVIVAANETVEFTPLSIILG